MNRRNLVYGTAATLAAIAGVGVAWWEKPAALPHQGAAPPGGDPFWALSFDTPDGRPLAMSSFKGNPLVVNFWATWCPPCVEELPLLDGFYSAHKEKGWQVLGLAVDQPSAVRSWLQARPLGFTVGMAGLDGTQLSKNLGNTAGGLPFTVVFGADGQLLERKVGKVDEGDLAKWVKA